MPSFPRRALILIVFVVSCRTSSQQSGISSGAQAAAKPSLPPSEEHEPRNCKIWADSLNPAMYQVSNQTFATPGERLWQYLWQGVRQSWSTLSEKDREALLAFNSAWQVPLENNLILPLRAEGNIAGEDFLSMNHKLMARQRDVFAEAGQPCLRSWPSIPDTGEKADQAAKDLAVLYPVPDANKGPTKSPAALEILKAWELRLKDSTYLQSLTLSELGTLLQFTLSNNLQLRWANSKNAIGPRPRIAGTLDYLNEEWAWNQADYDNLADTYSAAANRDFWKIRGFIDGYIYRWLSANGYREIAVDCTGKTKCYQWRGNWEGVRPKKTLLGTKPQLDEKTLAVKLRNANELLKILHKNSRIDTGAITPAVIADLQNPELRKEIMDPAKYLARYVKLGGS